MAALGKGGKILKRAPRGNPMGGVPASTGTKTTPRLSPKVQSGRSVPAGKTSGGSKMMGSEGC